MPNEPKDYATLIRELTAATLKSEYASREKKVPDDKPKIAVFGSAPGAITQRVKETKALLTQLGKHLRKANTPLARDAYLKAYYNKLKNL